MLATTVSQTVGASANASANTPDTMATTRRNLNTNEGSRMNSLVPMAAPTAKPTNWNGSTAAARYPRWSSSRLYVCSYRMPARLTKPISDTDRNGTEYQRRRSDGISLHSRNASSKLA